MAVSFRNATPSVTSLIVVWPTCTRVWTAKLHKSFEQLDLSVQQMHMNRPVNNGGVMVDLMRVPPPLYI